MPTTRFKNTLYRILLPFFSPGCGSHPVSGITGHDIIHIRSFEKLLHRHHVLGSSTLLVSGNSSALILSSSSVPSHQARPETFYRVASITKLATAVLILHLSDLGMISLDDRVSDFFSSEDAVSALDGITFRHLLSHTSGIVDPPDLEYSLENKKPFPALFPGVRHDPPGKAFHYSNLGFGLIGCILESLLNDSVGTIFQKYLFDPLRMNSTLEGCLLPDENIMPVTRVFPWRKGQDLIHTSLGAVPLCSSQPLLHYGHTAGSMYTDIFSLKKLLQAITVNYKEHFLSDVSVQEMMRLHASYGRQSPTLSYGLGLLIISDSSVSAHHIYGHQGFAYGCADGLFWEESSGRILIFLNGGCSEARIGKLGIANRDMLRWAFGKELPSW